MNALAYYRVSTDDQGAEGNGMAAQVAAISAYAARKEWTVSETFSDVASGKTLAKRPGLKAALERLEDKSLNGRRPRALIVSKLDRLARSNLDFWSLVERARRNDWRLVVVDMDFDLGTPMGEAMAGMMSVFAQLERRMIGERTRDAMREVRRRTGKHMGRPLATESRNPLERSRIQAALPVLRALHAEERPLQSIANELNARGLTGPRGGRWDGRAVQMALRRYGARPKKGEGSTIAGT